MPSRRTFLKASSFAYAASTLQPMLHGQSTTAPTPFSNQNLEPYQQGIMTRSTFKAVLQTIFTLFVDDGSTRTMRLVDVSDPAAAFVASPIQTVGAKAVSAPKPKAATTTGIRPAALPEQSFTLSFVVAGGNFSQGTYTVDHATLGRFALFVVPSSTDSSAVSCTAVFNNVQLTPSAPQSLIKLTKPTGVRTISIPNYSVGSAASANSVTLAGSAPVVLSTAPDELNAPASNSTSSDAANDTSTTSSECKDDATKTADGSVAADGAKSDTKCAPKTQPQQ